MNILIAPDSFKGSVTAAEACQAMKKGIVKSKLKSKVDILPMADGGEGTMISLVEALDGSIHNVEVESPSGRRIIGQYGIIGENQTAVIELASASGLNSLIDNELDPYSASTYGTGQLILNALNNGIRHFIICLGGSATNDGGSGILKALGFKFYDKKGNELDAGGLALRDLESIDDSRVNSSVYESFFQIACDVNNPLVGPNGASAVFGPQKGASSKMVQKLDEALIVFGDCIEQQTGQSVHDIPGSGAAGGAAGGLLAFLDAKLKPGISVVMEAVNFKERLQLKHYDVLLTGEGKIDDQTASGKVVAGLAETAKESNVPTVAITGAVEGELELLYQKGLIAAFSITDGPMSLEKAMTTARILIEKQTEQIFRLLHKP